MRALALDSLEATPGIRELEPPVAGDGELLIRVQASSANPVDNAIAAGMLSGMVEHDFPVILGRDYAVPIQRSYALEQAGDALAALASTHKQGKLAITFD
jgi:NADPH:quinone reductase-like Zn-dependent oxidoreductase